MPRIKSELAEGVEPEEGRTYAITEVEVGQKTEVQGFVGHRVQLEPTKRKKDDENVYATMLWDREQAGVKSKLGSFLAGFLDFYGDEDIAFNTDNWIGCVIRVVKWAARDREIEIIEGKSQ